jgi:hypothetical protein
MRGRVDLGEVGAELGGEWAKVSRGEPERAVGETQPEPRGRLGDEGPSLPSSTRHCCGRGRESDFRRARNKGERVDRVHWVALRARCRGRGSKDGIRKTKSESMVRRWPSVAGR